MDKITLAVVVALLAGALIGYFVHGFTTSSKNTQSPTPQAATDNQTSAQPGSTEAKIQDALSAAPQSVAAAATVLDFPATEGGEMVTLKQGTNDWTCLPDYPGSPGKDPMCLDKQGMLWMQGYMTQKPTNLTQAGIGYMLQGGSDASNTDPFATKPTEGNDWITTPSHLMIFPAGKLDATVYGTDPKKGGSWIMWAGTPYEHLMVPVK